MKRQYRVAAAVSIALSLQFATEAAAPFHEVRRKS
jgi:hypothetical protein